MRKLSKNSKHKFSTFLPLPAYFFKKVGLCENWTNYVELLKPAPPNFRKEKNPNKIQVKFIPGFRPTALFTGILLLATLDVSGQIHRIGAGFSFASGTEFNYGETGNPGVFVKTWLAVNKASTLHVVPSVTAYNRYKRFTGYSILTNYMFHGDLDFQYTFYKEGTVKALVFAGGNVTYLTSNYEPLVVTGDQTIEDASDMAFGGNLGAGLELRMAPKWDFNISGKYVFSQYSQFIISVQAVYYFKSRRVAYRR